MTMQPSNIFCIVSFIVLPCYAANVRPGRYSLIRWINEKQSLWTACENFADNITENYLKRLNGVAGLHPDPEYQPPVKSYKAATNSIPKHFDSRQAWPKCSDTIANVRHQGSCGSCWAFASAEVMTDRLCIDTNGTNKFYFSPEDLLECCTDCAAASDRCLGGYASKAWEYWIDSGLVSGGDYNTPIGCKPYSYSAFFESVAPKCRRQCQETYDLSYTDDKQFGKSFYMVGPQTDQIQTEIMTNGPVVAIFEVYEDFYYYGSGVYRHIIGPKMGNHAVKIIGWGTEYEVPYWLVVNSWGRQWARLGGFFKILRGSNHCGIEAYVIGGNSSSKKYAPIIFIVIICYVNVVLFEKYFYK